ncbi:TPA: hypothetical protein ACLBZV_005551 [Bacillus cereus]|uniref:ParM/StbA family protein n=1 Tax=Bacillus cereus TaxID=1396 RepID=UPI001F231342|nr:ParM/StbA family protein [Bacillus cereus]BCC15201.1 peptide ABC transporter substrate-binding protein [Bacillus cereus]HDR6306413.1 ParM/StbA family protein [Bacillus cereus]
MTKTYVLSVANDNGNSEHKLTVNGTKVRQPNVYARISGPKFEKNNTLEQAIQELHGNIDVTISSPAIADADNTRFLIGHAAMMGVGASKVKNMNLTKGKKHEEDLPIINTLGIIATKTVQKHFEETKEVKNNDMLEVTVNMSTCLPASVYKDATAKKFKERFQQNTHLVTVNIKSDLKVIVKINFGYVGVTAEGTSPLFEIIEDGQGNYRTGEMFKEFSEEYKMEEVDGSYFADKNLMHVDIGDGTTELILTHGYDVKHSSGLKYGLGVALEEVSKKWEDKKSYTRQDISDIAKSESHAFHSDIIEDLNGAPLQNLASDISHDVKQFLDELRAYQIQVMVVYGGGSILLKNHLYNKLKEIAEEERFQLLWIPSKFSVDMNVNGLDTFNKIYMEELIAEAAATAEEE